MSKRKPIPVELFQGKKEHAYMAHMDHILIRANDPLPECFRADKVYVFTSGGVAKMLRVSLRQIQILSEAGKIRHVKLGSPHRRYLLSDVQDYIAKNLQVEDGHGTRTDILLLQAGAENMDKLKASVAGFVPVRTIHNVSPILSIAKIARTPMEVTVLDMREPNQFTDWLSILGELGTEPGLLLNLGKVFILSLRPTPEQKRLVSRIRKLGGQAVIIKSEGHDPDGVVTILRHNYKEQLRVAN